MLRIKRRTSGVYTLTAQAVNEDGALEAIAAPYAVTVKDGAGATVSTGVPVYDGTAKTLTFLLTASLLPRLDTYTITWSGTVDGQPWSWTDELELVGGYLFEIADLRASDKAFTNTTKYPTADLAVARISVEETIEGEKAAAVAFVPRGGRATVSGTGRSDIRLPRYEVREVYALSVDGVAYTSQQIAALIIDDDRLFLPEGVWDKGNRNIVVHYAHGRDYAPGPIVRAALMLAKEYIVASDTPSRATATSVGTQWFRVNVAGRDGITGLPDVDAAIDQHGRKRLLVG